MEYLQSHGYNIVGFDPAYEGPNPYIIRRNFCSDTGLNAQGIILRHVLEHIKDPVHFLQLIRASNNMSGLVYMEVPCLDWISQHGAWFDIYYEHVNYFRMRDLQAMFEVVVESGHMFGGQYIYIIADLETLKNPVRDEKDIFCLQDNFLNTVEKSKMVNRQSEVPSAIWGCSSKGVIFLMFMERSGIKIDYAIDINPQKQGKYLPATGTLVSSPQDAMQVLPSGANIFVMNSNYTSEIINISNNRYRYHSVEL